MTNASTLSSYGPFVAPGTSGNVLTSNGTAWTSAAAASGSPGPRATVYTTAGSTTFTIPSGVTQIKVTVVGGGGSSAGSGCAWFNGNTGGTSSISSGTQTISTVSATGGSGGSAAISYNGGLGSGGDLNGRGGAAAPQAYILTGSSIFSASGVSGAGLLGAGGTATGGNYSGAGGGNAIKWLTGLTPGNTISVTVGAGGAAPSGGAAGGAGVVIFEY